MASRSHIGNFAVWIAMIDLIALVISSAVAVALRIGQEDLPEYVYGHMNGWLIFFGSIILANYFAGSYKIQYSFSRFNLVVTWLFSMIFSVLVLSVFSYAWLSKVLLGRGILLMSIVFYSVLSLVFKMAACRTLFLRGYFVCKTVIMGIGARARDMKNIIESEFILPVHKVVAFVNVTDTGGSPGTIDGVAVINGTLETFEKIIRNMQINLIITTIEDRQKDKIFYSQLRHLRFEGIELLNTFGAIEMYLGKTPMDLMDEDTMVHVAMESGLPVIRRFKRFTDVLVSVLSCPIWLPVGLIVACLIKITEPRSPILYSQLRIGQFGRVFRMYKFRTMVEGAEKNTGPTWSVEQDPRITPLGRILRKYRLDEIPQLINVLKGEMSLVGPRPERPELHAELEKKIPFFGERLNVMPGLTGWAQIRSPYGNSVEDAARKLEYDIYYIKHLSISLDLQIILRTIRIVLFGLEKRG